MEESVVEVNPVEKPYGYRDIIAWLLLFFFPPVGLVLMWMWLKWPKWVKILITFLDILLLVAFFILISIMNRVLSGNIEIQEVNTVEIIRKECLSICDTPNFYDSCVLECIQEKRR